MPHQRQALTHANKGVLAFKIPDAGLGQKPFDMFVLTNARAYVAIMFYTRGCKHFYLVPIESWSAAVNSAGQKRSLTEPEVAAIGERFDLGTKEKAKQ